MIFPLKSIFHFKILLLEHLVLGGLQLNRFRIIAWHKEHPQHLCLQLWPHNLIATLYVKRLSASLCTLDDLAGEVDILEIT